MDLQDAPEMLAQKFEELKEWQRQQQEKLLREQEAQRALLSSEQRRLYQEYGLDNFGPVDVRDFTSTRPSYTANFTQEPQLHAATSCSPPDYHHQLDSPPPNKLQMSNDSSGSSNCNAEMKHNVSFDDVPIPPPKKDFNQLLHEKLANKGGNENKKEKSTVVIKRPFLRKGEGLARFGLDAAKLKRSKKVTPVTKSTSAPKANVTDKKKSNFGGNKPTSNLKNIASVSGYPGNDAGNNVESGLNLNVGPVVDLSRHTSLSNNESSGLMQPPTWSHALTSKPEMLPSNLHQATWSTGKPEELPSNQQQATWSAVMSQQVPWSTNKPQQADKVGLSKKELDELRVFELLEQKAANSSFCSTSSTIARLLDRSPLSTPNKQSLSKILSRDFDASPQQPDSERSLHIRFTENRCKTYKDSRDVDSTLYEDSMESAESSVYENKETCFQTVRNVKGSSGQTSYKDVNIGNINIENQFQTLTYTSTNFQDNVAWSDDCSCSSINEEECYSKCGSSDSSDEESPHSISTTFQQHSQNCVIDLTIRSEPNQEKSTSPLPPPETPSSEKAPQGEIVYHSDLLRKRLEELETEIEIFRKENADLTRLKRSNELHEAKLNKERKEFEKSFQEKEESLNNLISTERKKLANDKKVFERYCKDLKSQPSKAEREEIVALKLQVENLREELVTKDSRWSATQVRTRDRVKQLERENADLKAQVHKLRREIQEAAKLNAPKPSKVSDTKVMHAINNHIGRIKPSELKNYAVVKNSTRKSSVPHSALTKAVEPPVERPIWGARNLKFRRTKSVPDVRQFVPPPSKIIVKRTRNLNRRDSCDSSGNVSVNSESDSEPEQPDIDTNAVQRFDKLQKTIYDTFYNNVPGFERELTISERRKVQSGKSSDENVKDSNSSNKKRVEFQPVPELLTSKPLSSRASNMTKENDGESDRLGTSLEPPETNNRFSYNPVPNLLLNGQISSQNDKPSIQVNPKRTSASDVPVSSLENDTPIETVKANGNREKSFSDGRREIWYPNGNVKKISADKSNTKMIYFNGDVKETQTKDSTVKYYYAETKTWHSTYADGLEILEFSNGQVERRTGDGMTEITFPNGCVRRCHADGREEWALADGTQVETNAAGEKVVRMPNGQREVHTLTHKRREYPDGTVKLVYPDGLQETRYSNGRIRLKDKDGALVMDSSDILS